MFQEVEILIKSREKEKNERENATALAFLALHLSYIAALALLLYSRIHRIDMKFNISGVSALHKRIHY